MKGLDNIDKTNMQEMVDNFPNMIGAISLGEIVQREAIEASQNEPEGVAMIGMGGSAIAGQFCKQLLIHSSNIPLLVSRQYVLPKYVNSDWEVIAVSYSGNTEETLSSFLDAQKRGCDCFAISSGGELVEKANESRLISLPSGFQPRATLPMIFSLEIQLVRLLCGFDQLELESVKEAVSEAKERWGQDILEPQDLAKHLMGRIPLFFGAHHLDSVAYRAKCQVNENAKSVAFHLPIPESNHNEVEAIPAYSNHNVSAIFLRSSSESRNISKRFDSTIELFRSEGADVIEIKIQSLNPVAEILSYSHYVDDLSLQISKLRKVNPVGVPTISKLKRMMAERD